MVAAWIIPYAPDKKKIVPELLDAVHDEDETVRNNATRALAVLAKYSAEHSSEGIIIPWNDFIIMTGSLTWTDRNKGLAVLESLTRKRDPFLLKKLKEQSLTDLAEMAKWKNPGHALYAFIILGRVAGIADEDIFKKMEIETAERVKLVNKWIAMISKE